MIENVPLRGGSHLLRVEHPEARRDTPVAQPGQFVQMRAHPSLHLLRRPMSILDEGDGWRSFMVKPVGAASRELVSLPRGSPVDTSPAFGRGFPPASDFAAPARASRGATRRPADGESPQLLLVGGGFGIAPLHFLARRLDALPSPPSYAMLYGGRTARDVEIEVLEDVRGPVLPSTDDGTLGFHGTCVQLASEQVRRAGAEAGSMVVLTCGPHAMMAALHRELRGLVGAVYVSLEEVMACGVGVCMGCVVPTAGGYVPICTRGPVFRAEEVLGFEAEVEHV